MSRSGEPGLAKAYAGKRVFLTGHTGFKGGWLALWLSELGADVTGYSLPPPTEPSFFVSAGIRERCRQVVGDVRDAEGLRQALAAAKPDYVFHLAAQSLVRRGYQAPIETLETNVMGTAHLLEAIRAQRAPCSVVVVTSDKCYENHDRSEGYRENEPMGGDDPYSMSKGAAELLVSAFRKSYFPPAKLGEHGVAVATARAGNVIGGGDWAAERLVPDVIRALTRNDVVAIRNPDSVRPWQHVIEPVAGYLLLGARLSATDPKERQPWCEGWNFGPDPAQARPVRDLVAKLIAAWGSGRWEVQRDPGAPHEAARLHLNIGKARERLGWHPRWSLEKAVSATVGWYRAHHRGASVKELQALSVEQIERYLEA